MGSPSKPLRALGYCPPCGHLVNQQGGQQPSLTTENVDRGHFYTQPFNLCLCWRHSCCGQEEFPQQLAVDDAQLILVICEEQEEHQWRPHWCLQGRSQLPRANPYRSGQSLGFWFDQSAMRPVVMTFRNSPGDSKCHQVWKTPAYSPSNRKPVWEMADVWGCCCPAWKWVACGPGRLWIQTLNSHNSALTLSSPKLVLKTCKSRLNWQYKISVFEAPNISLSFLVLDYVLTHPFQVKSK